MKPLLKTGLFAALPLAGTLCFTPVASADQDDWQGSRYEDRVNERDLRSFERYLNSHPETAQQLYQNPALLRDYRFVRDHDALEDWLQDHPEAAQAMQAHPHKYLSRTQASRYGSDRPAPTRMSERDLLSFERYLDTHDETAQALYQNPHLINDRQFVRDHDALENWLQDHPEAAQALHANPDKYLWRERNLNAADFLSQLLGGSSR
jgi:hypothetical protein